MLEDELFEIDAVEELFGTNEQLTEAVQSVLDAS